MTLDLEKFTALVVVDAQNDFVHPDGRLYTLGAESIIPKINFLILKAATLGVPIFYSRDWHPEKTNHFDKWPRHCVADSWGARLHSDLILAGQVFNKATEPDEDGYSAFTYKKADGTNQATPLDDMMFASNRERTGQAQQTVPWHVAICGFVTDVCVKATAMSALWIGYNPTVISNCCVGLNPDSEQAALTEMADAGIEIETYGYY